MTKGGGLVARGAMDVEAWSVRDDPPLGVDDAFALVSAGGLIEDVDGSERSRRGVERGKESRGRAHAGRPPPVLPRSPFGAGAAGLDRERSFAAAWEATLRRAHRAVVAADAEPVAAAAEFLVESHEASLPTVRAWRAGDATLLRGPVPLAVLAACGACPADRAGVREGLARALRRHDARVALLEPADFAASGASGALAAALSRLASPGELGDPRASAGPLEDLVSWISRTFLVSGEASASAEDDDLAAPAAVPSSEGAGDVEAVNGSEVVEAIEGVEGVEVVEETSQASRRAHAAGKRRKGRSAPVQRSLRSASAAQVVGVASRAPLRAPLPVLSVLVEDAEAIDPGALADLVRLLSECHGAAPVSLTLSLLGSAVALEGLLPHEVLDRSAACAVFPLATPVRRLEAVARRVLLGADGLGPPGGVALGRAPVERLLARFFEHSASISDVLHGISVLLAHTHAPQRNGIGSYGATAASTHLEAATPARSPPRPDDGSFDSRWRRWAIAGLWLGRVARAADRGAAWPLWRVLLEFSGDPEALAGRGAASDRVASLCASLRRELASADPEAPKALAAELVVIARAVAPHGLFPTDETALRLAAVERVATGSREAAAKAACEAPGAAPAPAEEEDEVSSVKPLAKRGRSASQTLEMRVRSRTSRAAALRAAAEVVACERRARDGPERSPAETLAAALDEALRDVLSTPPTLLYEYRAWTCVSAEPLDALAAAPRDDAHAVLSGRLGAADRCDAAVAYELFDSEPSFQNVADWFEAFVSVIGDDQADNTAGKAGKKRKAQPAPSERADRVDLAARFTAATAELMLLGLVGPATRRRGDYVHRLAHFPPGVD